MVEKFISMPVGVIVSKTPGVTRWAKWAWKVTGVIPNSAQADWRELRREGDAIEYHAGTVDLVLHRTDTEAYLVALSNKPPSVYVALRKSDAPDREYDVFTVTASAYEGQDLLDSGEDLVEQVPMSEGLMSWVWDFVEKHHTQEEFKKRRRDRVDMNVKQDGIGDERIRQQADVYRAPRRKTS